MLDIIFLCAAVVGGTVMILQFLMTLTGLGDDGSGDTDFGGHGDMPGDIHGDFGGDADIAGDVGDVGDVHGDFGADHHTPLHHAADADVQAAHSNWLFGVLSFRTIVAALAFFGVAGKTATSAGQPPALALLIAAAAGLAAMYGTYWLMRSISKLNSSGNLRIGLAIGREAQVYIPVPASEGGQGKVQLTMQNQIVEYAAVTADELPLKTGEAVEVVGVVGADTLRVRRL